MLSYRKFMKIYFLFFPLYVCVITNRLFVEQETNSQLGLSNQLCYFRNLIHHMISSKVSPANFYIFGAYSGHIGVYKKNCSIKNFLNLKNGCKAKFKSKISCEYILGYLKKVNFISKEFSISETLNFTTFNIDITDIRNISGNISMKNVFENTEPIKFYPRVYKNRISQHFFDFFEIKNEIVEISSRLRYKYFKNDSYNAMHLRLKDFKKFCHEKQGCYYNIDEYLLAAKIYNHKTGKQIFMLSNEDLPVKNFYKFLTYLDMHNIQKSHPKLFDYCFTENLHYIKLFAEIVIACQSEVFFYNPYSSFSGLIMYICKSGGYSTKFKNINIVLKKN